MQKAAGAAAATAATAAGDAPATPPSFAASEALTMLARILHRLLSWLAHVHRRAGVWRLEHPPAAGSWWWCIEASMTRSASHTWRRCRSAGVEGKYGFVAWLSSTAVSCSLPCALGDAAPVQECAGPAGGGRVPAGLPPRRACGHSPAVALSAPPACPASPAEPQSATPT